MDDQNKRKYPRISTNFFVKFSRDAIDSTIRQLQEGLAENCSTGGMFIATDRLFSRGSVLNLEFNLNSETMPRRLIQARAIVRWIQRIVTHPGMGVEFLLFNGFGKHEFAQQLEHLSQ
ncbi:hypothetical protein U27_04933 [Candidatus Vecturithrix granuli]|uniref:PilZ domain-containing protein n=1 Tax=Vecturithrix granuli TaxID=1499967 RepID=A0A081C056_VECG1|nr:hypothetical protein U27_04933 [Candidatus Vecturithrix granuli]